MPSMAWRWAARTTNPFVLCWFLLEAPARSCTVVVSDTAPVRQVIRHGQNRLLVEFFDGEQLVEVLLNLLHDPFGMQDM